MRCGMADRVALVFFLLPAVVLALANPSLRSSDATPSQFFHAQSAAPKKEPVSQLSASVVHMSKKLSKGTKDTAGIQGDCPKACDCALGDKPLFSGTCFHFCSEEYQGVRYCGESADYTRGASVDCRKCREPANFGATVKVYEPSQGTPRRSLILLNPWNGTPGFMWNWTFNQSGFGGGWRKDVSDHYRVLDVAGKLMPGSDYRAWFGYATSEDWSSDTPIQREVDVAVAYIHHLIEQEYKVVGDYKRIILAGMSQGAGLALEAALNFPKALGLVLSERGIVRSAYSKVMPRHFIHARSATSKEQPGSQLTSGVVDKLKKLGKGAKSKEDACPKACACAVGDKTLVNGTCLHFCSEEFEGVRYCGASSDYSGAASIDCRECREPASPYVLMMGKEDHYYGVELAKKSCKFLHEVRAPVLMKAVPGLEHDSDAGAGRGNEMELALDILAAIPTQAPADAFKSLESVTDWTACD